MSWSTDCESAIGAALTGALQEKWPGQSPAMMFGL
jgi:hypothetical protein